MGISQRFTSRAAEPRPTAMADTVGVKLLAEHLVRVKLEYEGPCAREGPYPAQRMDP